MERALDVLLCSSRQTPRLTTSHIDADVVFLDVIESPQRVKLAAAIGQRLPAFATASGKAMLTFKPEGTVRRILGRGMPFATEHAARSPEIFLEDLCRTRERGFALAVEEYWVGINTVAAPVLDLSQQPVASVSVAGPTYRLTLERMIEIGPQVVAATREIAHQPDMAAVPVEPSPAELSTGRKIQRVVCLATPSQHNQPDGRLPPTVRRSGNGPP